MTHTSTRRGASNGCDYKLDLHFLHPVDPSSSVWKVLPRSVQMNINKASVGLRFWPRLLHDKAAERGTLSVDWNKFVDETEHDSLAGLAFDLTLLKDGCRFTEVLHDAPTVQLDDILNAAFNEVVNAAETHAHSPIGVSSGGSTSNNSKQPHITKAASVFSDAEDMIGICRGTQALLAEHVEAKSKRSAKPSDEFRSQKAVPLAPWCDESISQTEHNVQPFDKVFGCFWMTITRPETVAEAEMLFPDKDDMKGYVYGTEEINMQIPGGVPPTDYSRPYGLSPAHWSELCECLRADSGNAANTEAMITALQHESASHVQMCWLAPHAPLPSDMVKYSAARLEHAGIGKEFSMEYFVAEGSKLVRLCALRPDAPLQAGNIVVDVPRVVYAFYMKQRMAGLFQLVKQDDSCNMTLLEQRNVVLSFTKGGTSDGTASVKLPSWSFPGPFFVLNMIFAWRVGMCTALTGCG
jgi:hypothetical protein